MLPRGSLAAILLAISTTVAAQEWTWFRGPKGSGVSAAADLPSKFGHALNVEWQTQVPPGFSSPVVTHVPSYGGEGNDSSNSVRAVPYLVSPIIRVG